MSSHKEPKGSGLCLLCRHNTADKKNSHIVPKFLTKSLFSLSPHRQTVAIHKSGKSRFHQDTPKEDFILCTSCEKRIEVVETYFAPIIKHMHGYKRHAAKFEHVVNGPLEYLRCLDVNRTIFDLFLYSIVWRLSVSNLEWFRTLKLPKKVEESIRLFLDQNLCSTKKDLMQKCQEQISRPDYHIVLIKPKIKTDPPGGMLSAHSYNENEHLITLVDFILFFFVKQEVIKEALRPITNNLNDTFIIGMGDNKHWIDLNSTLYHQVLDGMKS